MNRSRYSFLLFIPFTVCASGLPDFLTQRGMEEELFTYAYETNAWMSNETRSGLGSSLENTTCIRKELPAILERFEIKTVLDAGCGDFNWFKEMPVILEHYYGIDIVRELIEKNRELYGDNTHTFLHGSVTDASLPQVDAIVCRCVLTLLFFDDVKRALQNFKKSGAKYLIMSHFPRRSGNPDLNSTLRPILWMHPINFEIEPFNFPQPLVLINEGLKGSPILEDKHLAVWALDDLPDFDDD